MRDLLARDISSTRLLLVKAALFVVLGSVAGVMLLARDLRWSNAILLAICIWGFARAYYFSFYVLEHYVDPSFRFSGLFAALRYLVRRRGR
jgi:hypothetical protein